MTFTCIRCLADTDNDCDICDDCIADSHASQDRNTAEGSAPSSAIRGQDGLAHSDPLTPCSPPPPSQPGGEAERRLRALADNEPVQAAYGEFPHPFVTMQGDIRHLLARAEASEQKLAEAEAEIERMTNLEGFTYGHLEAAKEEIAALEQRLSAALGELHSLLALGLYDDAEPALILARKKSASLEALLRRARPLLDGSHDALKYVWSKVRPASRKDAEDCLAALATLSSEITALLPSGTGEAEGEGR